MTDKYVPPAVWKMENSDGGQWSSIKIRPDSVPAINKPYLRKVRISPTI